MSEFTSAPVPGWYYAEGDPPGTHRYWDGVQWRGDATPVYGTAPSANVPRPDLAGYGKRVIGFLVDLTIWIPAIAWMAAADDGSDITTTTGETIGGILIAVSFLVHLGNRWILQGITGRSIGKRVAGTKLIQFESEEPAGVGRVLGRGLLGALFGTFSCNIYTLLDLLWPAWDANKQRLTDKIVGLTVIDLAAASPAQHTASPNTGIQDSIPGY